MALENELADKRGSGPDATTEGELLKRCDINIDASSPVTRKIKVSMPESVWREAYSSSMALMKSEVVLPGFRKGRAPQRVIEKRFGEGFRREFIDNQVGGILEAIVAENNYRVLGEPAYEPRDLTIPNEGPLTFTLDIEILPEVPLPDLSSISLLRPKFEVTEDRINKALEHLRRTMGMMQPAAGPIEREDHTFIKGDITQSDGTVVQKIEGARVFDRGIVSDVEIPGLNEYLLGKATGDPIEIAFQAGPGGESAIPRDVDLTLKGEIIHNSRLVLPEIDEEFAISNGFENIEDLHTQMRDAMVKRLQQQSDAAVRSQLMEALENAITFPLPSRFYTRHLQSLVENQTRRLMGAGVTREQVQANINALMQTAVPQARLDCIHEIILNIIGSEKDVQISREDIMDRLLELSQQAGENIDRFAERARQTGLIHQIARELGQARILDGLVKSCNVREISEEEWKAIQDEKAAKAKALQEETQAKAEPETQAASAEEPLKEMTETEASVSESAPSDAT